MFRNGQGPRNKQEERAHSTNAYLVPKGKDTIKREEPTPQLPHPQSTHIPPQLQVVHEQGDMF